jgi:Xaa-Pro aminopeptidase
MSVDRIQKLRSLMIEQAVGIFYSENPLDFLYLLNYESSKGILIITSNEAIFFQDPRFFERAKKLSEVEVFSYETSLIQEKCKKLNQGKIAFSGDKISYNRVEEVFTHFFPTRRGDWVSCDLVESLRMIKDLDEIEKIKQASTIAKSAYEKIDLEKELSEFTFSQTFKKNILELGAETYAYEPIVAYDYHAAIPHHQVIKTVNKPTQEILVDLGARVEGYNSDMTDTILLPQASAKLKEFYQIVQEGYFLVLQEIRLGIPFFQLTEVIVKHFKKYQVEHLFLHSLGHNIGLEVHEMPFFRQPHFSSTKQIEENMVFTIEPGLYDPKIGGVRLENTIWVTRKGPISLTNLDFS